MSRSCADSFYIQLVYEYLLHMGLESTAACLKEECKTCNYPVPEEICGVQRSNINHLLQCFDEEDEARFFQLFNSHVPHQAKCSIRGKKMIADILVYFAALALLKDKNGQGGQWIKPLVHAPSSSVQNYDSDSKLSEILRSHSHVSTNSETLERTEIHECCGQRTCNCSDPEPESLGRTQSFQCDEATNQRTAAHPCMNSLLQYLESECSSLRNDPYFIQYFALPFIVCPQSHHEYKYIFQGSWPKSVRRRLWDFLVHHRQAASPPSIVRLLPPHEIHLTNQKRGA